MVTSSGTFFVLVKFPLSQFKTKIVPKLVATPSFKVSVKNLNCKKTSKMSSNFSFQFPRQQAPQQQQQQHQAYVQEPQQPRQYQPQQQQVIIPHFLLSSLPIVANFKSHRKKVIFMDSL